MSRTDSKTHLQRRFRVRPLLVRFVVSALALALTALIVPHVYMTGEYRILSWLLISVVFGLLVAFVKPLIQLLLLPFIFVSYGLVVVLINTCVLWLLDLIFPTRFQVESLVWALVAGAVSGALVGLSRERPRAGAADRRRTNRRSSRRRSTGGLSASSRRPCSR